MLEFLPAARSEWRALFFLFPTVFALCGLPAANAQEVVHSFRSNGYEHFVLRTSEQARYRHISVARGGSDPDKPAAVLYVLDPEGFFDLAVGLVRYLATQNEIPEMMVVGVHHSDRTRDLTSRGTDANQQLFPNSGDAEALEQFLADDLLPFIDSTYNPSRFSILFGHSLGGLFASSLALSDTSLFTGYIAASPSLWWNDGALVSGLQEGESPPGFGQRYFAATLADEDGLMKDSFFRLKKWSASIDEGKKRRRFSHYSQETHTSIPLRSLTEGLRFVFEEWSVERIAEKYQRGGWSAVLDHYSDWSAELGYQVDPPASLLAEFVLLQYGESDFTHTRKVLDYAIRLYPEEPAFYRMLGTHLLGLLDSEGASQAYSRALSLNPAYEQTKASLTALGVDFKSSWKSYSPEKIASMTTLEGNYFSPFGQIAHISTGETKSSIRFGDRIAEEVEFGPDLVFFGVTTDLEGRVHEGRSTLCNRLVVKNPEVEYFGPGLECFQRHLEQVANRSNQR